MLTLRYLRVSTAGQADDDRFGLPAQDALCTSSESRHGLQVVKTYTDMISGAVESRDGLNTLKREAHELGARAISISAIDRLSRDLPGGYKILTELLQTGLDVYSSDMSSRVNFADSSSLIHTNISLLVAHLERQKIRERTYGGALAKARSGRTVRKLNAYGYQDGQLDEAQAEWVRWIFNQAKTLGTTAIAQELNRLGVRPPRRAATWSKGTVSSLLRNPVYMGESGFGREFTCTCGRKVTGNVYAVRRGEKTCVCGGTMRLNRVTIPVPALIESEAWHGVQATLDRRRVNYGKTGARPAFELQGRIRCTVCGGAMSGHHQRRYHQRKTDRADPQKYRTWLEHYLTHRNGAAAAREAGYPAATARTAGYENKKRHADLIRQYDEGTPLSEVLEQLVTERPDLNYYYCRRAIDAPEINAIAEKCSHNRLYRIEGIHESVLSEIHRLFSADDETELRTAMGLEEREPEPDFSRERMRLERELQRAKEAYLSGVFELGEYAALRQRLEASLQALPKPAPVAAPVFDLRTYRVEVLETLELLSLKEIMSAAQLVVHVSPGGGVSIKGEPI